MAQWSGLSCDVKEKIEVTGWFLEDTPHDVLNVRSHSSSLAAIMRGRYSLAVVLLEVGQQ